MRFTGREKAVGRTRLDKRLPGPEGGKRPTTSNRNSPFHWAFGLPSTVSNRQQPWGLALFLALFCGSAMTANLLNEKDGHLRTMGVAVFLGGRLDVEH